MRISTSQLCAGVSGALADSLHEPVVITHYNRPIAVITGLVPEQIDEEGPGAIATTLEAYAKMLRAGIGG
jgi:hypothetical protein